MNAYTNRKGWEGYLDKIEMHLEDLRQSNVSRLVFSPSSFRDGNNESALQELCDFCGLSFREEARAVYDASLYQKKGTCKKGTGLRAFFFKKDFGVSRGHQSRVK